MCFDNKERLDGVVIFQNEKNELKRKQRFKSFILFQTYIILFLICK